MNGKHNHGFVIPQARRLSVGKTRKLTRAEGPTVWENSKTAYPSLRKTSYREIEPHGGDGARDDKAKSCSGWKTISKQLRRRRLTPSLQQVRSFACMQHLLCS